MSKRVFLNLKKTYLEVYFMDSSGYEQKWKVKTLKQFITLLSKLNPDYVLFSSSLDFPKEYTDDKSLIDLCDKIRNM